MALFPEKLLSVDLSSPVSSLSLHETVGQEIRLLGEKALPDRQLHSELFLTTLQTLLDEHGWKFSDLEGFVTSRGPGSFTGLRIAYASLLGFVQNRPRPIYSLSGSETRMLAYSPTVRDCRVLSKIATGRFVEAKFENRKLISETEQTAVSPHTNETIVLTDGLVKLENLATTKVVEYPLRARDLGSVLPSAQSLRRHGPENRYSDFTPSYFGSSQFD